MDGENTFRFQARLQWRGRLHDIFRRTLQQNRHNPGGFSSGCPPWAFSLATALLVIAAPFFFWLGNASGHDFVNFHAGSWAGRGGALEKGESFFFHVGGGAESRILASPAVFISIRPLSVDAGGALGFVSVERVCPGVFSIVPSSRRRPGVCRPCVLGPARIFFSTGKAAPYLERACLCGGIHVPAADRLHSEVILRIAGVLPPNAALLCDGRCSSCDW